MSDTPENQPSPRNPTENNDDTTVSSQPPTSPTDYQVFIRQFKKPECLTVVNDVRAFLKTFPKSISKENAVRKLHQFLSVIEDKLLATSLYEDESEEFRENGCEGLEKFVTIRYI